MLEVLNYFNKTTNKYDPSVIFRHTEQLHTTAITIPNGDL